MILFCGTKNASSWSFRAWLALKEAGLAFEEESIDLTEPARRQALERVGRISPSASVPALVEEDVVIFDSMAIMEYANERCGGLLLPENARARAVARSLLAWQHSDVGRLCPRLSFESAFYENKRAASLSEVADAERLLSVWSTCLTRSGGPYLMGPLSLADLSFVPTVIRIFSHAQVPKHWREVMAWIDALEHRPCVREWMAQASRLPPVHLPEYLPSAQE
jgi:glutathione S-transferase